MCLEQGMKFKKKDVLKFIKGKRKRLREVVFKPKWMYGKIKRLVKET